MLLKTVLTTDPAEALQSYVQTHPGAEVPSQILIILETDAPDQYEIRLVNNERSRYYERALFAIPWSPAQETEKALYKSLLKTHSLTEEQVAVMLGYKNGTIMRNSHRYKNGEVIRQVIATLEAKLTMRPLEAIEEELTAVIKTMGSPCLADLWAEYQAVQSAGLEIYNALPK